MNFSHRLFACAALCGSVACSEDGTGFEPVAPAQQLRTVVIGCAGIDITTRTDIDDRSLAVRWVSGDSIRLWAREHSNSGEPVPAFALENIPFAFDYYSPSWSLAAFTGRDVDMSRFDFARRYDYFAVSPTPASVAGTLATFDIPAVQSGEFDGRYDIMTAQLPDAPALEEGDTNWSVRLPFEHHVHVFRITIPQNSLETLKAPGIEEAIRSIELTFPDPVTGRLTVDATGATAPVFAPAEGGNVLTLRFDRPKRAGDVVYAFIARQEPLSGDQTVVIRATGASGGDKPCVSLDRSFAKTREFTRGAVTTLNYNIPERYRCTKILFSLAEKAGGEAPDRAITDANGYGWGTLGEPVESFRIVDASTGEELPKTAFACDHVANRYEIACTDEGAHTAFVDRYAGKKCIAELTSRSAEVEYAFTFPSLDEEVENTVPALEVPYLFEEDFSGLNQSFEYHSEHKSSDASNPAAISLDSYGLSSWSGTRVGAAKGLNLRIVSRTEIGLFAKVDYNGRVDSAPIGACLRNGKTPRVAVRYDYGGDRYNGTGDQTGNPLVTFGYTNTSDATVSLDTNMTETFFSDKEIGLDMNSNNNNEKYYGITPHSEEAAIPACQQNTRLSWKVSNNHGRAFGANGMYWLYIDNIKASIAH